MSKVTTLPDGAPGALVRAVGVFRDEWDSTRAVFLGELLSIALAGISLSWMKLDAIGGDAGCVGVTGQAACWLRRGWLPLVVSVIVALTVLALFGKLRELQLQMGIADNELVAGDWHVSRETRERLSGRRRSGFPAHGRHGAAAPSAGRGRPDQPGCQELTAKNPTAGCNAVAVFQSPYV